MRNDEQQTLLDNDAKSRCRDGSCRDAAVGQARSVLPEKRRHKKGERQCGSVALKKTSLELEMYAD